MPVGFIPATLNLTDRLTCPESRDKTHAAAVSYSDHQESERLTEMGMADGTSRWVGRQSSEPCGHERHRTASPFSTTRCDQMSFWAVSDLNQPELDTFVRALDPP